MKVLASLSILLALLAVSQATAETKSITFAHARAFTDVQPGTLPVSAEVVYGRAHEGIGTIELMPLAAQFLPPGA